MLLALTQLWPTSSVAAEKRAVSIASLCWREIGAEAMYSTSASYSRDEDIHSSAREHYHTLTVGIVLILLQALITALASGLALSGVLAVYRHPASTWALSWAACSLIFLVSWLVLLRRWLSLTDMLERRTGLDIDGDGLIAGEEEEQPAQQTVRVELASQSLT